MHHGEASCYKRCLDLRYTNRNEAGQCDVWWKFGAIVVLFYFFIQLKVKIYGDTSHLIFWRDWQAVCQIMKNGSRPSHDKRFMWTSGIAEQERIEFASSEKYVRIFFLQGGNEVMYSGEMRLCVLYSFISLCLGSCKGGLSLYLTPTRWPYV